MSNLIQKTVDSMWQATFFKILPKSIKPSFFTTLRFILIPVILLFLALESFTIGFILFLIAGLCDSIDGSLARVRGQLSDWGKLLDPIADKLLILLTTIFLAFYYPYPTLIFVFVVFDFLIIMGGVSFVIISRQHLPVSFWGKLKMVLEVVSILIIFIFLITGAGWILSLSVFLLFLLIFIIFIVFNDYIFRFITSVVKE